MINIIKSNVLLNRKKNVYKYKFFIYCGEIFNQYIFQLLNANELYYKIEEFIHIFFYSINFDKCYLFQGTDNKVVKTLINNECIPDLKKYFFRK